MLARSSYPKLARKNNCKQVGAGARWLCSEFRCMASCDCTAEHFFKLSLPQVLLYRIQYTMTTDEPAPAKKAAGQQGPACRDVGQLRQEVLDAIGAGPDHPEKRQKGSLLVPIRVNVDREDGEDVREVGFRTSSSLASMCCHPTAASRPLAL